MNQLNDRVVQLNNSAIGQGDIVYYPVRDLRIQNNWALHYAQQLAIEHGRKLRVLFVLYPDYIGAGERQYVFMFQALKEFEAELEKRNIPFEVVFGLDIEVLNREIQQGNIGAVITDFSPLRRNQEWKNLFAQNAKVPVYEVDTHNVIPAKILSQKLEFAAYTIRPKVYRLVGQYLELAPELLVMETQDNVKNNTDWDKVLQKLSPNKKAYKVSTFVGGHSEAKKKLDKFNNSGLKDYGFRRNDPNEEAQSDLSPYITFGCISKTEIVLEVLDAIQMDIHDVLGKDTNKAAGTDGPSAFLEELIVRSELAENFCLYNSNYDNFLGFHEWAQKTLNSTRDDVREYVYSLEEFELAKTHDQLWNAAQNQMLKTGKMHGYLRMYWAKKILEWTNTPEDAQKIAIYLNDLYELDGRDPNGYAGIAWSIGGVHDRAWNPRNVFGMVRYMNYEGCKRKFKTKIYEEKWNTEEGGTLFT